MKPSTLALVAALAGLGANSALAHTRVSIGVTVGAPLPPPRVVVVPALPTAAVCPPTHVVVAPRGYWKEVVVQTWVPTRWVATRDRWGRPVRVCEPGHYAYRTDRIWIDDTAHPGHHRPAPRHRLPHR